MAGVVGLVVGLSLVVLVAYATGLFQPCCGKRARAHYFKDV